MTQKNQPLAALPKQCGTRALGQRIKQGSSSVYPPLSLLDQPVMLEKREILLLQNTVGNQAVQRMLRRNQASHFLGAVDRAHQPVGGFQPAVHSAFIQRKKGSGESTGSATGEVGVAGGESATPSDQDRLADGYLRQENNTYLTPNGRTVSKEQAEAESRVINSAGIFMGAYLARYRALKRFNLAQDDLDRLSANSGFMQQYQTGDVVLRMMDAEDSEALAKITESNYSHSGIIQKSDRGVWVLDSYPGRKFTNDQGLGQDSTQLIRFEEFFDDHGKEKIVRGLVLRVAGLTDAIKLQINELIKFYDQQPTTFDYDFKIDNDKFALYCSELVWRILTEAKSPVLPPNEFATTQRHAKGILDSLQALIVYQKSHGTDTTKAEQTLQQLKELVQKFDTVATKELYSPGSLERTKGLDSIAGFTREGKIEGSFKVIVLDGSAPNASIDTPDCYVKLRGSFLSGSPQTKVQDDTTTPSWNEVITSLDFDSLQHMSLELWDEDVLADDLLATFDADLRPVKPNGQIFTLRADGSSLRVKVEAENPSQLVQAPRKEAK